MDTVNTSGAQEKSNATIQDTVIALFTLGSSIGAMPCIKIGDWSGRRRTIFCATGIATIGAILMASSFSLAQLMVSRLVLGVGSGGYTATIPVWQSEISGAQHRGAFVNAGGIFLGLGIVIALLFELGFYFIDNNSVSWRFPFAVQILFLLMVMAFIFTPPESPRWLVKKGRLEEVSEVLTVLKELPPDSEEVRSDIATIQQSLADNATNAGSLRSKLRMGPQRIFHCNIIAALGQLFQQMNGVNLTVAYANTFYEEHLGFGAVKSRGLSIVTESLMIVGGTISVLVVDRLGRRPLMLVSAAVMAIWMAVHAGTTSNPSNTGDPHAATFFLFLYTPFFAVGSLSLTNLYATEVAPLEVRAPINGVSTATTWMANFVVLLVTPIGFDNIGYRYWTVWAVINAAIVPTVYFVSPETNGKSLEEMDAVLGQSSSWLDPPRIARRMTKKRVASVDEIEGAEKD